MAAGMNMHCPKCWSLKAASVKSGSARTAARCCRFAALNVALRRKLVKAFFVADCGLLGTEAASPKAPAGKPAPPSEWASASRARSGGNSRGRAQDGHSLVRGHQGLDRADGATLIPKRRAPRRSDTQADDRCRPSLRRLRRAIDRRRHFRAVRRSRGPRRSSATVIG